jgi:predicted Zn-dependent protease
MGDRHAAYRLRRCGGAQEQLHRRSDAIQSQTSRHPDAAPELQRAITAEPDKLVHRDQLAQVLLLNKSVDAAEAIYRLINIDLNANQLDEATALIDEVLKQSPRDQPNSIPLQRSHGALICKSTTRPWPRKRCALPVHSSANSVDLRLDLAQLLMRTGVPASRNIIRHLTVYVRCVWQKPSR